MSFQVDQAGLAALTEHAGQRALTRVSRAVLAEAKATVHVDTGNLRDHLRVERDDDAHYIGSNVAYGGYEERLHPYLRPALWRRR